MKWKLLSDSSAALRLLSNFSDRLVYSFPSMQFSASFNGDVWPMLSVYSTYLPDEKKWSDTLV